MNRRIISRFPWLSAEHPLSVRDAKRINYAFPKFIRKLSDPWTLLGYAALLHGILFMVALLGFQHLFPGMPSVMVPFLTPVGTPVAAAFLHSILYWAMLIGICNYTTLLVGRDIETRTWDILRLTPFLSSDILKVKLVTIVRRWSSVLRAVVVIRILALILIPVGIGLQQHTEVPTVVGLNFVEALVFVIQPFVDVYLVAALSVLSAIMVNNPTWAKLAAYSLSGIAYGLLSGLGALWLILKTPIGMLGGLFIPLGHWAPLLAAATPGSSAAELVQRMFVVIMVYAILPVLIGTIALIAANNIIVKRVN